MYFCCRFKEAWSFCEKLNDMVAWLELGRAAMQAIEIDYGEFKLRRENA